MKRLLLLCCAALLALLPLAGGTCESAGNEAPRADEAYIAALLRLNGNTFIYCPDASGQGGWPMTRADYSAHLEGDLIPDGQAFLDLDGDGFPERVLRIALMNVDSAYGYLVLNESGGQVYGRELVYRAMMNLRFDGSFEYSASAAEHGFARLRFDGAACETVPYTYVAPAGDAFVYFANGAPSNAEGYFLATVEEHQKAAPAWLPRRVTGLIENREAMALYQQALKNDLPVRFSGYYDGTEEAAVYQETTLAEAVAREYGQGFSITALALLDLDGDGLAEIAAQVTETQSGSPYEYIVLKAENALDERNRAMYAHQLVFRAFRDLKADGTFSYSSGAMDSGFGRAWFSGPRHGITPVSWSESGGDGTLVSFFVDGLPAAEDAFARAARAQDAKAPALWLPLTDSVVDALPELPY